MGCYNPAYSSNSNPTPVGACFTQPMTNFSIPQYSYGQLVDPDLQRIEQLSKQSRLSTEPNKAYDEKSTKKSTSEKKVKKAKKETSEIQSLPSEEVNSKNGKTLAIPLLPSIEENKARAEKSIKTSPPPEVSKPHEETSPKSLPPTTEVNMETSEISMKKLSQSPNKADVQTSKKRNRHVFTKNQLEILILEFEKNPFVIFKKTRELSKDLNITEKQVTVWFKNRRMKMRSNNIPIWRVKIV
ncbi:Homeobox protein MOX-1 [Thelohanellus kitauei]|uniref:Homeobox protein MOX-1 n=1 Tax=Thelohanellus kitauei TaxID=669202 RepID=A0A0C2JHI1_THEKT|nr:Homeobox protein MOX-1 [Thelohanellus kitauei]